LGLRWTSVHWYSNQRPFDAQDGFVCVASSTHVQEMEMQFNSLGSGLRKLANEANDFVQELLMPPTFLNDNGEATEKGVDLKKQCNVGIVHGQKKNVEQPTAAPLNFVDGACIEISAHGKMVFRFSLDLCGFLC